MAIDLSGVQITGTYRMDSYVLATNDSQLLDLRFINKWAIRLNGGLTILPMLPGAE